MKARQDIAIKVCGMRDPENIAAVASLGPQYLGFIFYPKSPRYIGKHFTMPDVPASIKRVGVFVDESTEGIKLISRSSKLEFAQLHGNESAAQCHELKAFGLGVIKVFSINDDFDFDLTKPYREAVDYFLFDTKGKYYGGNAKTFNWEVLRKYDQEVPFFLSGGLSPDNVKTLGDVQTMNLHALDLNSGVEISPGFKDLKKVQTIIASYKY